MASAVSGVEHREEPIWQCIYVFLAVHLLLNSKQSYRIFSVQHQVAWFVTPREHRSPTGIIGASTTIVEWCVAHQQCIAMSHRSSMDRLMALFTAPKRTPIKRRFLCYHFLSTPRPSLYCSLARCSKHPHLLVLLLYLLVESTAAKEGSSWNTPQCPTVHKHASRDSRELHNGAT